MIRAIQAVVLPAIDPDNSLAREQATLVAGQLKLLAGQWNRADGYARICLADLLETVGSLSPAGGRETLAAAEMLKNAARAQGAAEDCYKGLMAAADRLVRAADQDGDAQFFTELKRRLLDFSLRQSTRDRSWFAGSGFDLKPSELIPIDDIVSRQVQS